MSNNTTPTTAAGNAERARFEAWAKSIGWVLERTNPNGLYDSEKIQDWWEDWQARAALSPGNAESAPDTKAPQLREALERVLAAGDIIAAHFDPGPIPASEPTQADIDFGNWEYEAQKARATLTVQSAPSPARTEGAADAQRYLLDGGLAVLVAPDYHRLNAGKQRLLHALLCAYAKHHLSRDEIGWELLSETLLHAICEEVGDNEYLKWSNNL